MLTECVYTIWTMLFLIKSFFISQWRRTAFVLSSASYKPLLIVLLNENITYSMVYNTPTTGCRLDECQHNYNGKCWVETTYWVKSLDLISLDSVELLKYYLQLPSAMFTEIYNDISLKKCINKQHTSIRYYISKSSYKRYKKVTCSP